MHRITTLAAGLLALSAASAAFAGESALVGRLKQDGTIQIFKDRFRPSFPDGTPVATIQATPAPGGPKLTRAAADGCLAETTALRISENPGPDGSRGLWAVDWHFVQIKRCYDNGCRSEFQHGAWTASCKDFSTFTCACVRENTDQVIIETQGYCTPFLNILDVWDLDDWFHPQFVQ